jgi:ABC-2 type transport system permease protein
MKKFFNAIFNWIADTLSVFRRELYVVSHDVGVLIFFFFLPLVYPIVYTLIYNPEVVTDIPVAVVDHSRSSESRELVRMASAAPAIQIYSYCSNLAEAKSQMASGDVFGILDIPDDYATALGNGEQAVVQFYVESSLLIRNRAFVSALSDLQLALAQKITVERVSALGVASSGSALPVNSKSNFLGDTEQGFASFVIPGIIILILQQSMLLGICMLGGTERERRLRNAGKDPLSLDHVGVLATVLGRSLCYVFLYIPAAIYILNIIPMIFDLPHIGDPFQALLFIFPLLVASSFMGQALNLFMRERESAFILIVFLSVLFLFLSGLTWPRYAVNELWTAVGNCIPSTWGVEGFIRINSNGGTIGENATQFTMLWVLAGVYFVAAYFVIRHLRKHSLAM